MSFLDLSNEEEQREFVQGPVPAGSIVLLEISVLTPKNPAQENPQVTVTDKGLRQIPCQFNVVAGTYNGVSFRNNLTLPIGLQKIQLSDKQRTACRIGGSTLKAILSAARKPPVLQSVMSLQGLRFPARLGINDRPRVTDEGKTYWNNSLSFVITPDKEAYASIMAGGEIITDGPVTGKGEAQHHASSGGGFSGGFSSDPPAYMDNVPPSEGVDECPF